METSRRQGRKQSDVTRSNFAKKVTSRKIGARSQATRKGPRNESDGKTSDSSEVYKQDALREKNDAVPELTLGESKTVESATREGRGLTQAVGRQRKSHGKPKTVRQASSSATSRTANKEGKKIGESESSGRRFSRQKQKATENAQEVVNALDLEMGMPDEVPLVPVSRVKGASIKGASESNKASTTVSRKGHQLHHDESQTSTDRQASAVPGTAQTKGNTADPTMPETPHKVDLGGGLDEVEISRIRDLASSARSRKPLEVSRSGVNIPADVPASTATEVESQEAREQAVDASFRRAEEIVEDGVEYDDGRYGTCFQCGEGLVIPGVARFFCKNCGWLSRKAEIKSISPGHHD